MENEYTVLREEYQRKERSAEAVIYDQPEKTRRPRQGNNNTNKSVTYFIASVTNGPKDESKVDTYERYQPKKDKLVSDEPVNT